MELEERKSFVPRIAARVADPHHNMDILRTPERKVEIKESVRTEHRCLWCKEAEMIATIK